MLIELKLAQLHTPIFLAGTNLNQKLDPTKRKGLTAFYHKEEKELLVTYNGETAIVPITNVVSMIPKWIPDQKSLRDITKGKEPAPTISHASLEEVAEVVVERKKPGPKPKITAQVSSPTDHVFAGPGSGKTGREK